MARSHPRTHFQSVKFGSRIARDTMVNALGRIVSRASLLGSRRICLARHPTRASQFYMATNIKRIESRFIIVTSGEV